HLTTAFGDHPSAAPDSQCRSDRSTEPAATPTATGRVTGGPDDELRFDIALDAHGPMFAPGLRTASAPNPFSPHGGPPGSNVQISVSATRRGVTRARSVGLR